MTFWELLTAALASAGVFPSVLGAFLTYAARKNGEATRELIRSMETRMTTQMGELFERMDRRAHERHREVAEMFERMDQRAERMDQRADERHREALGTIRAQKAT